MIVIEMQNCSESEVQQGENGGRRDVEHVEHLFAVLQQTEVCVESDPSSTRARATAPAIKWFQVQL